MSTISRNPAAAEHSEYDLIIVGGGIYGAMLSLEAGMRGLRSLLLEQNDFGGATSYNSLRIVHGGFRYLQSLDLKRFYESVGERRWFLQMFPTLVKPLPCLMPLYGQGAKRPIILASALGVNDLLSAQRNQGVPSDRHLAAGSIISAEEVRSRFPQVDSTGLQGGAVWFDASMPDSQRVLMTVLHWACDLGSVSLNYMRAESLLTVKGRLVGLCSRDTLTGQSYEYRAPVVVNAAGPWSGATASELDSQINHSAASPTDAQSATANIFRPSLAWNLLFDRAALSNHALAITPKQAAAQTYFLHPWKKRLLAGTIHNPWDKSVDDRPYPSEAQLAVFIENLNYAIPNLNLQRTEVIRVLAGILPVKGFGSTKLSSQEVFLDHGKQGGINGFYSIAGVKFTTSRLVADRTLTQIFPEHKKWPLLSLGSVIEQGQFDYDWWPPEDTAWLKSLKTIAQNEAVIHLDDLIVRRTSLADNPKRGIACGKPLSKMLGKMFRWDEQRRYAELTRLTDTLLVQGIR